MKIQARNAESFLRGVGAEVAAVLIYGPDAGLVRERSDRLVAAVAGDAADPFAVSEISVERLREQPSLIADEAAALTFGGGRRIVRLRGGGDAQSRAIGDFLESSAGSLLVVEADDLGPRSSLRLLFEDRDNAAAVPCYREEGDELGRFIADELRRAGFGLADDAREQLVSVLGGDRGVTRREIEKLIAYKGPPEAGARIGSADVTACVGDSSPRSVEELAFAVAEGDVASVDRLTGRVLEEGSNAVTMLRAAARHLMRLHLVAAADSDRDRAMRSLRPPVFFKQQAQFQSQARRWPPARLHRAIDRLLLAEMDCKRTGMPAEVLCRQALMEIAGRAPR